MHLHTLSVVVKLALDCEHKGIEGWKKGERGKTQTDGGGMEEERTGRDGGAGERETQGVALLECFNSVSCRLDATKRHTPVRETSRWCVFILFRYFRRHNNSTCGSINSSACVVVTVADDVLIVATVLETVDVN